MELFSYETEMRERFTPGVTSAQRIPVRCYLLLLPAAFLALAPAFSSDDAGDIPLLSVQIPANAADERSDGLGGLPSMDRYVEGARIVRIDPGSEKAVNLTPGFWAACDPDVSFDGSAVVFAGKRKAQDAWHIWQMNADGSEKRQLTHDAGDHITPVYAGNRFYLNDPAPTPQIIYAASTHGWRDRQTGAPVFSLYAIDPEGQTVRRLTYNLHSDFEPDVLPTGRIVYTSTQKFGDRWAGKGRIALSAVSIDGTNFMPFYGNHEAPWYKGMAHIADAGEHVYFVEADEPGYLGGGRLAFVSQGRPLHSYQSLGAAGDGLWLSPCPRPDGSLLGSYRPAGADGVYGLYTVDVESGRREESYFIDRSWHTIDAQPLVPHTRPKGKSNWLVPGRTTGVFYCLASHRTNLDHLVPVDTDDVAYVRVIEGLPQRSNSTREVREDAFGARRLLGIAPVAGDGSFHIRVPADIPVTFQLLNEDYLALRTQKAWTWVKGNENRGCIGCHEDRELSPPNRMVDAVIEPPVDLTLPPERRRTVDYRNQIAPILASGCATAACHVAGEAFPDLSGATGARERMVFEILTGPIAERAPERWVIPGRAIESPLVWLLFGRRPGFEETSYSVDIGSVPAHDVLRDIERIQVIEWIDLGAQWEIRSDGEGHPDHETN